MAAGDIDNVNDNNNNNNNVPHFLFRLVPLLKYCPRRRPPVETQQNSASEDDCDRWKFRRFQFSTVSVRNLEPSVCFRYQPFNPCGYAGGHRGATAPIHHTRIVVSSSPFFYPPLFASTVIPPTETGLAQPEVDINNFFCAVSPLYKQRINTLRLLADKRSSYFRERSAELIVTLLPPPPPLLPCGSSAPKCRFYWELQGTANFVPLFRLNSSFPSRDSLLIK